MDIYLGVAIVCGIVALGIAAGAALYIWRKGWPV
jgi:hypothetical protein